MEIIKGQNIEPMNVELNKGFAIIIDDHLLKDDTDDINKIANIISNKGIPYCGYNNLNDALKCISNFIAVNFVVLDWRLSVPENQEVVVTDFMIKANATSNINFLKEFRKQCFAPVFIFSSENRDNIVEELSENGGKDLLNEDSPERNFIFIKSKSELIDGENLFNAVNEWIKKNPAIYTLKSWDNSFLEAKNKTFWHLFERSPMWPKILWDTYSKDSVDQGLNIMDTINKNISSRTKFLNYDQVILEGYNGNITKNEIKEVIQGIMFMNSDYLHDKDLQPGDIFKIQGDYYLNLRPICDTIIGRMEENETPSASCDGNFYSIKGSKMRPIDVKDRYNSNLEMINERIDEVVIYGVEEKEFFRFSLKKIYIHNFITQRGNRKCRLVSPYITHIQQKYSSYVGRFGLPRMPVEIITDNLPMD